MTLEKRHVPRFHLDVGGHGWRCDIGGAGWLRQRDYESHGESSGARAERDATHGLILRCIAVLHIILLSERLRLFHLCPCHVAALFVNHVLVLLSSKAPLMQSRTAGDWFPPVVGRSLFVAPLHTTAR